MINVLVIEDEENIRKIISKVLSREGYHVFEASSAEEGLDIIDKNLINLIVLDLTLPKMDGYEFTKEEVHATIVAGFETLAKSRADFTLQTWTMK